MGFGSGFALSDGADDGLGLFDGFALSDGVAESVGFPDSLGVGLPDGSPVPVGVGVGVGVGLGGGGVTLPVGTPARITGSLNALAQAPSPISTTTPRIRLNTSFPLSQRGREEGAGEVTRSR